MNRTSVSVCRSQSVINRSSGLFRLLRDPASLVSECSCTVKAAKHRHCLKRRETSCRSWPRSLQHFPSRSFVSRRLYLEDRWNHLLTQPRWEENNNTETQIASLDGLCMRVMQWDHWSSGTVGLAWNDDRVNSWSLLPEINHACQMSIFCKKKKKKMYVWLGGGGLTLSKPVQWRQGVETLDKPSKSGKPTIKNKMQWLSSLY